MKSSINPAPVLNAATSFFIASWLIALLLAGYANTASLSDSISFDLDRLSTAGGALDDPRDFKVKKKQHGAGGIKMAENGTRPSYERVDRAAEVVNTPYDRWISSQGVDVIRGFFVENLYTVPLKWWDRVGGYGVYIMLDGTGYLDDAYVCS